MSIKFQVCTTKTLCFTAVQKYALNLQPRHSRQTWIRSCHRIHSVRTPQNLYLWGQGVWKPPQTIPGPSAANTGTKRATQRAQNALNLHPALDIALMATVFAA